MLDAWRWTGVVFLCVASCATVRVEPDTGEEDVLVDDLLDDWAPEDTGEDAGNDLGGPEIPPDDLLCRPCRSHEECGMGGYCVGTARHPVPFCGGPCGAGCRAGFACHSFSTVMGQVYQCIPVTGRCGSTTLPDAGTPVDR